MKEIRMLLSIVIRVVLIIIGSITNFIYMEALGNGSIPEWHMDIAVDANENIYIGNTSYIQVYSPNGSELHRISARTSRGYYFTIYEERIYLGTGGTIYILDLEGSEIERHDEYGENAFSTDFLKDFRAKLFVDDEGTVYQIRNNLGRKAVVAGYGTESEVILQMPMKDYRVHFISRILLLLSLLSVGSIIYQISRNKF